MPPSSKTGMVSPTLVQRHAVRAPRELHMAGNEALLDHYRNAHATRVYGTSSVKYLRFLRPEIHVLGPTSILDYGCGQSRFVDMLDLGPDVARNRYDPAIPEFATPVAKPVDLLVNIDVLEHIEDADLDDVIADMHRSCRHALIIVDTKASNHTLGDGRNAHVSLHPHAWWEQKLASHFGPLRKIKTPRRSRAGFATWPLDTAQSARLAFLRAQETAHYYALRAVGRHKTAWKDSITGQAAD